MSITTAIAAGYGPLDQIDAIGIEEALVLEECAAAEYRTMAVDTLRRHARTSSVEFDATDFDNLSLV